MNSRVIGGVMLAAVYFSISAESDISSGPEDLLVSREARRSKTASSVHNSEFGISPEQGCN